MNKFKYITIAALSSLLMIGCSEDLMDDINKNRDDATNVGSMLEIPTVEVQTAFQTVSTDIAWFASVYIEHSAGQYGQCNSADIRSAQESYSNFNNNWQSIYDCLMILKDIREKCSPTGTEPTNLQALGIAQVLTAYNLAVLTDMWGEVPWFDALKGTIVMQPKFDNQSTIYVEIQKFLDEAIVNLKNATTSVKYDYIYNGSSENWIKAAYSLKARYALRLSNIKGIQASKEALDAIANGFTGESDQFMFDSYEATSTGENAWYQFMNDRTYLCVSKTLFDLMDTRNDPRIPAYFTKIDNAYKPAENGKAEQNVGGVYSSSLITENGQTVATPLMTYHELKFIEAEAKFRTSASDWKTSLKEAIEANFVFHGLTSTSADNYYTSNVEPLLTAGNELKEIMTQKYIALYEHEAIEAYNDYRRTLIPTLNNPYNQSVGFVWRFPMALADVSSNGKNVPEEALKPGFVYNYKVWWAGGAELAK